LVEIDHVIFVSQSQFLLAKQMKIEPLRREGLWTWIPVKTVVVYIQGYQFLNLLKWNQNLIVNSLFWLIWHQTKFYLVSDQLEECISIKKLFHLTIFRNRFLCVINQISYTFPIWHKMEFRLVQNELEKCNYNWNLIWPNQIQKRFICAMLWRHEPGIIFSLLHTEKLSSESCWIKPNLNSDYHFPIDLAPNRILFVFKSFGKMIITIQIWYDSTRFGINLSVCSAVLGSSIDKRRVRRGHRLYCA